MSVDSIRIRDFQKNDYTDEELDAMQEDATSDSRLNKARKDAGIEGERVHVRGDDPTNAELRKEWELHDLKHAGAGAIIDLAIEGFEGTILHAAGPFAFAAHALGALNDAEKRAEALKTNNERGAMHLGMITALDLPQGYKNVECGKWKEAGTGNNSGAVKIGTALETKDKKEAAVLQLHADRGMNAARSFIEAGMITRDGGEQQLEDLLSKNPDVRAKYIADPAYRAGFEALVWAKQHDEKQYGEAIKHLEARDARYAQHHIAFKG